MDNLENTDFEDKWRKVFTDASEMPPASVWERIEAQLDKEEEEKIVLLPWWNRWQTWAVAASIATLVVGGWFFLNLSKSSTSLVADRKQVNTTDKSLQNIEENNKADVAQNNTDSNNSLKDANSAIPTVSSSKREATTQLSEKVVASTMTGDRKGRLFNSNNKVVDNKVSTTVSVTEAVNPIIPPKQAQPTSTDVALSNSVVETLENPSTLSSEPIPTPTLANISVEPLDIKHLRKLMGVAKRQIWVTYQLPGDNQVAQTTYKKQYWTGFGIMPASFNAGVGIGGRNAAVTFASAGQDGLARTAVLDSPSDKRNNKSAFSYAIQYQGGMQLTERWSLETGVSYLQANSIFDAVNGFNPLSNSYINSLEAAITLSDFSQKNALYNSASTVNIERMPAQSLTTPQIISNSYQYLQLPIQTGFAIVKPKRKLSLTVLAGLINNIFLRNSFETGQERTITLNSSESPYRTFSWSAAGGVRAQYRVNKRWATMITGNYQYALGSTTRSTAVFEAHPQLLGISAGLRYGL